MHTTFFEKILIRSDHVLAFMQNSNEREHIHIDILKSSAHFGFRSPAMDKIAIKMETYVRSLQQPNARLFFQEGADCAIYKCAKHTSTSYFIEINFQ